jgi:tetratricopeptide (TPR) repeat protein
MKRDSSPAAAQAAKRHAYYYLEELRKYSQTVPTSGNGCLTALVGDIGNIRAAFDWSLAETGDMDLAVQLCALALPLFLDQSLLGESRRWIHRILLQLPESAQGTAVELLFQETLAITTHFTSENTEEARVAIERGIELCSKLNSDQQQFHLLAGLQLTMIRAGEFILALDIAKQYASFATKHGTETEKVISGWMLGTAHHLIGDQASAIENYTASFDLANELKLRDLLYFETNHRLIANIGRARVEWMRGFPEKGLQLMNQAIEESRCHPTSFCMCVIYSIPTLLHSGQYEKSEQLVSELNKLTGRYALGPYHQAGLALRGLILLSRGDTKLAIEQLQKDASTVRSLKFHLVGLNTLRALAEGLCSIGELDQAMTIINESIEWAERSGGAFNLPDLMRAKAEIYTALPNPDFESAQQLISKSIELAKKQSALSWELRSTLSSTKIQNAIGRNDALSDLALVYDRFTEGFRTKDLVEAAKILGRNDRSKSLENIA